MTLLLLIAMDAMDKYLFFRNFDVNLRQSPWDVYDLFLYLLVFFIIVFRAVAAMKFEALNFDPSVRIYYNLADAVYWYAVAEGFLAVFAWFLWFRSFKFLNELSWARVILQTLLRAAGPLLGLCLSGFLLLLAFAHVGLLAFGTEIHDLRSFGVALASCFRFIFGGMKYEQFRTAGPLLGPIFYISFKVWMVLIMVRFFVAVLLDAYREVMQERKDRWRFSFPPAAALASDLVAWIKGQKVKTDVSVGQ